uniref:Uncharacterized protein n=1 Tax=Anguilla anguilla TaxID=7936 RepID=A0A0E9WBK9_ANGAN
MAFKSNISFAKKYCKYLRRDDRQLKHVWSVRTPLLSAKRMNYLHLFVNQKALWLSP